MTDASPAGLSAALSLRRERFHLQAELAAPPGLTALLGPSGAGKSLTLQAIAGLIYIERGMISLHGRTLADTEAGVALPARLRRVGYVPQSYALFPHLNVAANVAYGLPARLDAPARAKRVAELLDLVRLPGYEARTPCDLSGGEAQRVALARALAAQPDALLLDEPFGALDAPTRTAIRNDLRDIALASGLPTLLVTHDLSEALALASRLALLVAGRVIAQGSVEAVTARPATALAARLLGWSGAASVERCDRAHGGARVTLACGQSLWLADDDCAADVTQGHAELALRPERLRIARVEASEGSPTNAHALRGVVRSVNQAGPLWTAQIALDGADPRDQPLEAPFSAREWPALALDIGAAVALEVSPGAARLVSRERPPEEAAQ